MPPVKDKMVQAIETFTGSFSDTVTDSEGNETATDVPFVVRKGDNFPADSPIVQKHGQFFGPVRASGQAPLDPEKVVF